MMGSLSDHERPIADAGSLFPARDDATHGRPADTESSEHDALQDASGEYDVEGLEEDAADDEPQPVAPVRARGPDSPPRSRPAAAVPSASSQSPERSAIPPGVPKARARRSGTETDRVDQVWSRTAEWGLSLALLAVVGLVGFLVFLQILLTAESLGPPVLFLMGGGALVVALSYPIMITLERPLRLTPEQAVKDFYEALAHHAPHYRRMWLLLSEQGRKSPHFSTYSQFKRYWKRRLAHLKGRRAGPFTPLSFEIADFQGEKSGGQTVVAIKFTVNVFIRGREHEGPLELVQVAMGAIRGPDNMWYLNKGTLPGERL